MLPLHPPRSLPPVCFSMVLGLMAWAVPARVMGQVGAEESARHVKAAEGLEARLWASEPMLLNPTNIDVDSRGRVWATEGLNYRLSRGGNARFHRVDDSDKIKILEDSDGDGKADKVTVFADRIFPVPMGIAVEERWSKDGKYTGCRVFVGNSPDLLVLEDTDGDDRADKRYALLTGFGGVDSDHGVHGMVLGLDGKLYFTHGDGCCSVQTDHSERPQNFDVVDQGGRHVKSDQLANTLRVNRDGTQFEVICDRQRNNYETCLNAFGNIFTSDNDDDGNRGCRVIWAMDGGHYGYRTPGSPRHWGEDVPGNVPKLVGTGNGSPCGIMVYEGTLLPKEYFGSLLEVDAGTRQVNFFPITRKGASFRTQYKVFLSSDDPWFRPVDACAAPDGAVFVADWYDAGVGGHAFSDQTTGRIYRVAPAGHKIEKPHADLGSVAGLVAGLRSPNVATQDAARRGLIARGAEAQSAVRALYKTGTPVERARALLTLEAMKDSTVAVEALRDSDPRIREMAVRMLGRDCRENGNVEYRKPEAKQPPPALAHLDSLLPLADDPDAGVRRELILALRNVPTEKAGEAIRKLSASWDGQDRWYLEALGLALERRESGYLSELFRETLFGDLGDLDQSGKNARVALPPFFPVDRNEAFIEAGTPDESSSALSKYLGLAWRIHRDEVVPLLRRVVHRLNAPELQQASDDILRQIRSPEAAVLVSQMVERVREPVRKRELIGILEKNLEGPWRSAKDVGTVEKVIVQTLNDPQTRPQGISLVAATRDARYEGALERIVQDEKLPVEERIAAVEAIGTIHAPVSRKFLDRLVGGTRGQPHSSPVAEAAVRNLPKVFNATNRLTELVTTREFPLGVRREALRSLVNLGGGARRILDMARSKTLPDDLKTEATTVLNTTFSLDRRLRDEAAQVLPLPSTSSGRPLPPIGTLIRQRGNVEHGRGVFFRTGLNACASCHRVRGKGEWVGPDLSTIGTKYGKDELLRSILNPSAAIALSYRAQVIALADGRVMTGLAVEDTPDRLVLKTADGQRLSFRPGEIEDRRTSDVSLMPEGLAQTMSEQEVVDLLAFLSELREPVSIAGQYHVIGPLPEPKGEPTLDPRAKIDVDASVRGPQGQDLSWRRLDANAEGMADLTSLVSGDVTNVAYALTPVSSPEEQKAVLVVDTRVNVTVWFNGRPVIATGPDQRATEPREVEVTLPRGVSTILIRLAGGGRPAGLATLVTTLVSQRPVSFDRGEGSLSSR
jgi:putative membrane-bound dehydrogenase-like protein